MGVVIAFLFTLGLVGVEVMLFHTRANKDFIDLQNQYFQEVKNLQEKNSEIELRLQKEIDSVRASGMRNSKSK